MGRELYESQPVFREALERCDALLRGRLDRPLLRPCSIRAPGEASPLDETAYAQPALFALEYALAELWRAWGVAPAAVLGHSVGEYVAACVAGVCSLEDGLRPGRRARPADAGAAARGRDGGGLRGRGRASPAALRGREADVAIAAVNGPEHTVVSGPRGRRRRGARPSCRRAGVRGQAPGGLARLPLAADGSDARARSSALAARSTWRRPRIGVVSRISPAASSADGELASRRYWRRHAREPVRFADGVRALAEAGSTVFLEIGPAPTLLGMAARCLSDGSPPPGCPRSGPAAATGRRCWRAWRRCGRAASPVDWDGFERGYRRRRVALPTSPFRRERYWVDAAARRRARGAAQRDGSVHPLLGERLRSALDVAQFESVLGPRQLAYLGEHRVHGVALAPASAFIEMALAAVAPVGHAVSSTVEDLRILSPLQFTDDGQRVVQVLVTPDDRSGASIVIASLADEESDASAWRRHVTAHVVAPAAETAPLAEEAVEVIRARCSERLERASVSTRGWPARASSSARASGVSAGSGGATARRSPRSGCRRPPVTARRIACTRRCSTLRCRPWGRRGPRAVRGATS